MSGENPSGGSVPMWLRITIVVVGIMTVVHEVLNEPRWIVLVVAMVMMGLVSPDIIDRWKGGPPT
jgi:uncharacterized protein (DUF983 family)